MSYGNIPNEDALEEQINEVKFWLPCPGCGKANGCVVVIPVGRRYRAACDCGWRGPSVSSEIEAIAAWNIRARTPLEQELREALDGDACLDLYASGLGAIAWHLEQGHDNAKIGRDALALALRALESKLNKARAALRHADGQ